MSLRIRQIVLAARDLAKVVRQFEDALGLTVTYRDPEVAKFGLQNALFAIGDQFIEIVAPTRADTAAGRHLDRHGDSAYMLILQTDDLARDRRRLSELGVRVVWESSFPDMRACHLHPKDMGAAIVSLDEATPPSSWRWAGPDWQRQTRPEGRIIAATIAAMDARAMAQRWSQTLGLQAPRETRNGWRLDIDDGALNFIATQSRSERMTEFGLELPGRALPLTVCGTTFRAVGRC